jgi:membrane protease YdiL (CAAX protease family)
MLLSFLGAALIGALVQSTTAWPPLDTSYIREAIVGDVVAYVLFIVLVVWGSAAFGEELFARGFVLDRMRILFGGERAPVIAAMIGQAALFGLLHAQQGPTGILITFYVGLVFAGAWYFSGRNLWPPILAHGLIDTISLTLMFSGVRLPGYIE